MLSVRSREDAGKGLGLGVGRGRGGEMEENELEEGEACSIQEDDASIDPDVSLSYIDAKIQDVLGHFQKDFEAGLSVENLGAKFGGYGSFLPAYQRSPSIWSHPRSPQRVPNHSTPRSPSTVEAAHQNPTVATSTTVSLKNNSVPKAPSSDGVKKKETCKSTPTFRECTPQHDLAHTASISNDQKILKVRIKVGSDNALPRPNATIYSDMGLEYSPSLSLEDSPGESGGFSPEPRDAPYESPVTIYQIMTCFPVLDGYVLSPLPDSLLHLMENERSYSRGSKLTIHKTSLETCDVLSGDSLSSRGKVSSGKKARSVEKHVKSSEPKSLDGKVGVNVATGIRKKEIDVDTSAVREFVSDALNVSMLSGSDVADDRAGQLSAEVAKGYITREPNKVMSKVRDLSPDLTKEGPLVGVTSLDTRGISNSGNGYQPLKEKVNFRAVPFDKASEERKQSKRKDASFDSAAECGVKSEKNCDALKFEADVSKSRKEMIVESDEPTDVKGPQESTLHEQNSEKMLHTKDHGPVAKGKSGNQINGMPPLELMNENSKAVSSVPSKEKKKGSHSKIDYAENKQNSLGPNKESSRLLNQEGYKDTAGDFKSEHIGKRNDSMESASKDKTRDSRTEYDKNILLFGEKTKETKERLDGKRLQNPPLPEASGKSLEITPLMPNGPTSDVPPAPSVHFIQENWVCCDKCQKWRLLPYGTNPDFLPKKWLCTMLTWLPGMNKCTFSEEETTKALHALYQAPTSLDSHAVNGSSTSVALFTDAQHVNQNHDPASHIASTYGKKKHPQKDMSHAPSDLTNLSNSVKKSQQASVKSRSLNDVNQVTPHSSSKSSLQHVSKSSELNLDKDNDRQKEKFKMMERDFNGVEFSPQNGKSSKSKGKRDMDQIGFRASKKVKAEGTLYADEDQHSDHDFSGRVLLISHNGMPTKMTNKNSMKDDDIASFKNSKCNSHDSLSGSRKKLNPDMQVSSNGYCKEQLSTFDEENFTKESVAKKRKVKERQEGRGHIETVVGHRLSVNVREEMSESESRKEKRSKVLKAEGKDSVKEKVNEKINKKGRPMKVLLSSSSEHALARMEDENKGMSENEQKGHHDGVVVSERNYNCLDSVKRDLPCVPPSTAATSSSSKVSGSRKSKTNFQEARGSPVESVSSSPLKISNTEKFVNKKNGTGKDEDKSYAVVHCETLDACRPVDSVVRDPVKGLSEYQDSEVAQMLVSKQKDGMHSKARNNMLHGIPPSELEQNYSVTGAVNTAAQHNKYYDDFRSNTHGQDEEKLNNHCHSSGSTQRKPGKSSSQPREKHKSSKPEVNKGKVKISESCSEREFICSTKNGNGSRYNADMDSNQHSTYHENVKDGCNRLEKKDEKKRESAGRQSSEYRRDNHLNFGTQEILEADHMQSKQHKDIHTKDNEVGAISSKGGKPYVEYNHQTLTFDEEDKSSNHFFSDRTRKLETTHGRGKSKPLSHSGDKLDPQIRDSRMVVLDNKGDRPEASSTDAATDDAPKILKQPRMPDSQNGPHRKCLRQPTPNRLDAPSPARRDSNPAVAVLLKEARDLKHTANRLKCEGLDNESTGLYFEAALKFLYVAFLLETSGAESGKHGETTQSITMYSDTAKLCDFCAREYEKLKEMAGAALAYKCMEVAYMKVVFSKHSCACKDRYELQAALQMASTGESPSSSASDVDNLNNLSTVDKAVPTKGASSPRVAGDHMITAHSRPNFLRLLNYVQDVNYAMEASRKSHYALNSAVNASSEELRHGPEIIASVRRVLDLGFHDVEGLLRLVRLSINSISR